MRIEIALVVSLLAGAPLAGCIDGGEELEPTSAPDPDAGSQGPAADEDDGGEETQDTASDGEDSTDEGTSEETASAVDGNETEDDDRTVSPSDEDPDRPLAVVAHVDTGINPYNEIFHEDSELAYTHPSEYIEGFPEDAQALNLTLDADSWQKAVEADSDVWANVTEGELYWIPGTRIVGAISFSPGGAHCPGAVQVPPVPLAESVVDSVAEDAGADYKEDCEDRPILDDHGHGTMTASRMAGQGTSLCPDCRIVTVEGLGSENTKWAAEQGWVDVQSNSWGSLIPEPVSGALGDSFAQNIEQAAVTHLVYFSSGNGFGGFFGFTPWPTHVQPTLREDVLWVGSHDNGRVAHWQGTPPHLVADGYRGLAAAPDELEGIHETPFACCSSASSPYAAGLGARLVQEARTLLDDTGNGPEDGVLVEGETGVVADGPLEDGDLRLDELRTLVKHTAEPRPSEGRHDGAIHWLADASAEKAAEQSTPWGPGGNPYCPGCVNLPYEWKALPSDAPAYPIVGYGGATPNALDTALSVLEGQAAEPDRSDVDEYFAAQKPVREAIQDPAP